MKSKATIKLVLDSRDKDEDKKAIKIRITFNRIPHLYQASTNIRLTKEEFRNPRLKTTKMAYEEAKHSLNIAQEIIDELGNRFSFVAFREKYRQMLVGIRGDKSLFSTLANEYVNNEMLKPKTRENYTTAVNWLYSFDKYPRLDAMTDEYIKSFVCHLKKQYQERHNKPISENSIRMYLRSLKAIYNDGIKKGWAKAPNPFANIKGQSLTSIGREKRALTEHEWKSFLSYTPQNKVESMGQDYFILSVQLCGANMCDILSLKNHNINLLTKEISYTRKKTSKSGLITHIPLTETAFNILNKYGLINPDKANDYVLPYLTNCTDNKSIDHKIHDVIKKINKGIASICKNLSIVKATTYNARHTYGAFIQEELTPSQAQKFFGHTNSRTTEWYFKDITTHIKDKNKEVLDDIMK